jgi:hypothetical protein
MTARAYKDVEITIRVAVDYDISDERAEIKRMHLADGLELVSMPRCVLEKIDTRAIEDEILNDFRDDKEEAAA